MAAHTPVDRARSFLTFIESNAQVTRDSKGYEIVDGLNLSFIRRMISAEGGGKFVDIIDAVLKTEGALDSWGRTKKLVTEKIKGSLLYVIQLILTPLSLHPDICNGKVSHFDVSQSQAYATSNTQPIFVGKVLQDINLLWLLHTINFFKFHFKTGHGEGIIAHDYAVIERDQYVQPWVGHIKTGTQPLSRFWKGAYSKFKISFPPFAALLHNHSVLCQARLQPHCLNALLSNASRETC